MRNEVVRTLPRGPRTSQSSRRTGECRPSTKNLQSAPPADLQPAVPRRLQRHELEVHETFSLVLPTTNQLRLNNSSSPNRQNEHTEFPEQPPRAGSSVPARPQPSHEQSSDNQEQTPTRTLNSPSPTKYQGSQELQKQARWRHQDDTKAPPNAHPTIRLGTWFVPSASLGHPRTHREHPHTPAPAAPQSTATAHPGRDTPHRQAIAGSRQITTRTE